MESASAAVLGTGAAKGAGAVKNETANAVGGNLSQASSSHRNPRSFVRSTTGTMNYNREDDNGGKKSNAETDAREIQQRGSR